MNTIVALGERVRVAGFRLAGADVQAVEDAAGAVAAWDILGEDTAVVILTPAAAAAIGDRIKERTHLLTVVMPP